MGYFESEKQKEYEAVGFKNQRRNLRKLKQVGRTTIKRDEVRHSLMPGKRVSASGKIYWETRKNRTDAPGSNI
jgi:hypothetical protein